MTNCGIWPQARSEADRAWAEALAGASAHSTLIADETLPEPAAVPTQAPSQAPMPGTAIAEDGLEAHALSAGYLARLGLIHARRLRLSAVGDRIEGEDRMAPPTGIATGPGHRGGTRVHVRFHLHPAVRASVIQDGQAVLLRLASGIGWRFEADFDAQGGDLAVADSVYCGGGAGAGAFPRKTHQIVLTTRTVGEGLALSWRFSRERKA